MNIKYKFPYNLEKLIEKCDNEKKEGNRKKKELEKEIKELQSKIKDMRKLKKKNKMDLDSEEKKRLEKLRKEGKSEEELKNEIEGKEVEITKIKDESKFLKIYHREGEKFYFSVSDMAHILIKYYGDYLSVDKSCIDETTVKKIRAIIKELQEKKLLQITSHNTKKTGNTLLYDRNTAIFIMKNCEEYMLKQHTDIGGEYARKDKENIDKLHESLKPDEEKVYSRKEAEKSEKDHMDAQILEKKRRIVLFKIIDEVMSNIVFDEELLKHDFLEYEEQLADGTPVELRGPISVDAVIRWQYPEKWAEYIKEDKRQN